MLLSVTAWITTCLSSGEESLDLEKFVNTRKGKLMLLIPVKFAEVCTTIVCLLRPDVLTAGPGWDRGGGCVTGILITRLFPEKGLKI